MPVLWNYNTSSMWTSIHILQFLVRVSCHTCISTFSVKYQTKSTQHSIVMNCLNNNSEQWKVCQSWGPTEHLTKHKDFLRALWQLKHTHTQTMEKRNHPHFSIMSVPIVRGASCCSIMMIKCFNPQTFLFFLLQGSLFAKWWKAFYDPTFLFQYVLFDMCCLLYFPDPSLNPTHPFNAVDKRRGADLCSETSWLSAQRWKNTYPHSPTSNSFSGIDAKQLRGQIISSQGKLPIVHAMKQDETWNMLAHNEWCVCARLLHNLPSNFLSFSLTLNHLSSSGTISPPKAITMTTAVRICTTVISVGKKRRKLCVFVWESIYHT